MKEQHGMYLSPEYRVWGSMLGRCYTISDKDYADYGGRGITVCDRWRSRFTTFYADMGARPAGLTLERIKNDKGYEPSNCRWATRAEQSRNRRPFKRGLGICGVFWNRHQSRFTVTLMHKGVNHYLGSTRDFLEACCLRKSAEVRYY